jgi:phage-related minor tail protein
VYIGCSAAYDGGCKLDNKRWYRVDHLERTILPRIAGEVVDDEPRTDPIVALEKQIAKLKAEATDIEQAYQRSMRRGGELAERTQAKLESEYTAKRDAVAKLERQLAALETAKPASEVQQEIGGLLGAALNGDVTARAKIANALPALIKRITCRKDGTLRVEAKSIKMGWTIVKWQSSATFRAG